MKENSIFNPERSVKLADGSTVTVTHLRWKPALKFFAMLKDSFAGLLNEKGELALSPTKVMESLNEFPELAEWLVLETTGKDEAFLEKIDLPDMSKLVFKALEINLGTIASEIKNFRGRLAALTAGEAKATSSPTSPPSAS